MASVSAMQAKPASGLLPASPKDQQPTEEQLLRRRLLLLIQRNETLRRHKPR